MTKRKRHRAALAAVAVVAGSLLVPLGAATGAPPQAAGRVSTVAVAKPQVVAHCSTVTRRPRALSWCDNSDYVTQLTWTRWGYAKAHGRGVMHNNVCRPSCAAGNFEHFRVSVVLKRVRTVGKHQRFTRAVFYNPAHGQAAYWMPLRPLK
jgi:hypothetical protein